MSGAAIHRKLRFGPFELSIGERVLRRDGQVLPLGGRALDILIYLADRPGEVIAKQELIDHVWSDVTVEEGSLRVHVAAIRKALGDGQFGNRYIANIKGRGYSFVGTVAPLGGGTETGTPSRHQGRLPARPTMMVGREPVLSEVMDKLRDGAVRNPAWPRRHWQDDHCLSLLATPLPRSLAGKSILLTWKPHRSAIMLRGLSRHPWDLHSNRKMQAWSWSTSFVRESFLSFSIAVST